MRWRTAAAPVVRRHCDTSGPARWCAGAAPAARRPAVSRCRLKVFSQATTGGPLRRHDVGSRFPLKMELEPTAVAREGCMSPSPRLAWASLGAAADRHPPPSQGTRALNQHQGGAGERPPFSTLRARPNEHPSILCAVVSGWPRSTAGSSRATPIQSQRICFYVN